MGEIMISRDSKQFSVKIRVPEWIITQYPDYLAQTFQDKLERYLGKKFRISLRYYKRASTCRFMVYFTEQQRHATAISELIGKVAKQTTNIVATKTLTMKVPC